MNKTVLITGGAGFVGSNLCEYLVSLENYNIYSLDDYSTGSTSNHKKGVVYIKGSTKDIEKLIDFKPDLIYHLGEYSRVEQSFSDIEKVVESNISGTLRVLEFARKHKCKLVYAGSSTKFGDEFGGKIASPYAWTKSKNTEFVNRYAEWFGINYAITYFYNVYGKGEISKGKYATLIGIFKEKYTQGEKLTVVKPGTQKRNFTHIEDIVSALYLVGEKGYGDGYGIGASKEYSVIEIAKMFGGEVDYLPERKGNRLGAELVCEKTYKLGWKAKYDIREHIENFKKAHSNE